MKAGIHPLYKIAKVVCACGTTFETRSTRELIKLEICSGCHPFFTGQQKLIDTAGRVERFKTRFKKTEGKTITRVPIKTPQKKLVNVKAPKHKTLTTAPKKEEKPEKKPAKKA